MATLPNDVSEQQTHTCSYNFKAGDFQVTGLFYSLKHNNIIGNQNHKACVMLA